MDKIYFTVNGENYTISGSEVSSQTSLNDYLRNYLQMHGTKAMCREGGCGVCVVAVSQTHPVSKEKHTFSVNSCLVHILACHQWDITTIEGVGNRKDGYHPIQSRLAAFNGTQCGYCTPGWVMNMYSLYESSSTKLTTMQVEKSFGGNLCRCTGYRPILDAFKSFANDADPELLGKLQDVEDLHKVKCSNKCERRCSVVDEEWCVIQNKQNRLLDVGGDSTSRWYKAFTVQDVFKVLSKEGLDSYRLVAGNTGVAVFDTYWAKQPRVFIDISSIEAIKDTYVDVNLVLGAGTTLTELMKICETRGKQEDFKYLEGFYEHLDLVAHVPVRNIGTIGGNLAMKNAHHEFPSDIFLLLETVQAMVTLTNSDLSETVLSMQDFLKTDLKNKLITAVKLPPLSSRCVTRSYKIMPRSQNALAITNAGFFFKLDSANKIERACITYGTISPTFIRATNTENALIGQDLFAESTLQKALAKLNEELVPVDNPPDASPLCRKTIALGLFYRAVLSLAPPASVNGRYVSGGSGISRGVSSGMQTFDTDKTLWPLNKPIPKLEALTQCSGEVSYACDVVASRRSVHVAFVLSTVCLGEIERFDASEALNTPGVVAFFTAKDIPGSNTFISTKIPFLTFEEELLASKNISYYGQPVALVAATSHMLALSAADMVKVYYKESKVKPVLSVVEALVAPDREKRLREDVSVKPKNKGDNTTHVIKGKYSVPSQYHFTMETQSCAVSNTDQGLLVRSATQWIDLKRLRMQPGPTALSTFRSTKLREDVSVKPKSRGDNTTHVIKGKYSVPSQYHFTMETQSCAVSNTDQGLLVRSATQWMDLVHVAVAGLLGIDQNKVLVSVGRLGGGYGGKASRSAMAACACALVAYKLDRDAQLVMPLEHNMLAIGKRQLCYTEYELGVNDDGLIQYMDLKYYSDCGYNYNDASGAGVAGALATLYGSDTWAVTGYSVLTDKAADTWCRAPGTTEAIAIVENILEQIAHVTKKDPIAVRITNLAPANTSITDMIDSVKQDSNYNERKVQIEKYNSENAWKKKGLKLAIMSFPIEYFGANYPVIISVYHGDGTISISHGGIEMGQGINTKVAQVCAYTLKVPLEKISVFGSDSFKAPNTIASAGSITSECVAFAAVKACTEILQRLEPMRDGQNETWEELVKKAFTKGINLQASYMTSSVDNLPSYDVYGVCAVEVELDVLTGRHDVTRVDLLEDVGVSLSPDIDVGQIEGAFVMGLGMWTSEELVWNAAGRLGTARTWGYHPPGARDHARVMRLVLRHRPDHDAGVLRSKATGEPSLTLAVTVCHALRDAILAARKEFGYQDDAWLDVDTPYTVANILKAISPKLESFKLN